MVSDAPRLRSATPGELEDLRNSDDLVVICDDCGAVMCGTRLPSIEAHRRFHAQISRLERALTGTAGGDR